MKWCDFHCPHAAFPDSNAVDGAGSCRTFIAVYCRILEKLVHKNLPCPVEQTKPVAPAEPA